MYNRERGNKKSKLRESEKKERSTTEKGKIKKERRKYYNIESENKKEGIGERER